MVLCESAVGHGPSNIANTVDKQRGCARVHFSGCLGPTCVDARCLGNGQRPIHMSLLGPDGASAVHDWWNNYSRCSWAADHPVGKDMFRAHDYKSYAASQGHIGFSNRSQCTAHCDVYVCCSDRFCSERQTRIHYIGLSSGEPPGMSL